MRNVELEEENKKLTSQLQENKVENDILQKRLIVPMKDCLQRNEELHGMLDKLRTQQATVQSLHSEFLKGFSENDINRTNESDPQLNSSNILFLKCCQFWASLLKNKVEHRHIISLRSCSSLRNSNKPHKHTTFFFFCFSFLFNLSGCGFCKISARHQLNIFLFNAAMK